MIDWRARYVYSENIRETFATLGADGGETNWSAQRWDAAVGNPYSNLHISEPLTRDEPWKYTVSVSLPDDNVFLCGEASSLDDAKQKAEGYYFLLNDRITNEPEGGWPSG